MRFFTFVGIICFLCVHSAEAQTQATLVLGASSRKMLTPIVESFSNYQHCVLFVPGSSTSSLNSNQRKSAALDLARDVAAQKNDFGGFVEVLATSGSCAPGSFVITRVLLLDAKALFDVTNTDAGVPSTATLSPEAPVEMQNAPEGLRAEYFFDRILRGTQAQGLPPCATECRDYHYFYVKNSATLSVVLDNLVLLSGDGMDVFAKGATQDEMTRRMTKAVIEAAAGPGTSIALEPGESCGNVTTLTCNASVDLQCTLKCDRAAANLSRRIVGIQQKPIPKLCMPFLVGHDVPSGQASLVAEIVPTVLLEYGDSVARPVPLKWRNGQDGSSCRSGTSSASYIYHSPIQLSQLTLQSLDNDDAPVIARDRLQKWISISIDQEFDANGKVSNVLCNLHFASSKYVFGLKYARDGFFTPSHTFSKDQRVIAVELRRLKPSDDLSQVVDIKSFTVDVPFRISN